MPLYTPAWPVLDPICIEAVYEVMSPDVMKLGHFHLSVHVTLSSMRPLTQIIKLLFSQLLFETVHLDLFTQPTAAANFTTSYLSAATIKLQIV